jgi:hypothetical protein
VEGGQERVANRTLLAFYVEVNTLLAANPLIAEQRDREGEGGGTALDPVQTQLPSSLQEKFVHSHCAKHGNVVDHHSRTRRATRWRLNRDNPLRQLQTEALQDDPVLPPRRNEKHVHMGGGSRKVSCHP